MKTAKQQELKITQDELAYTLAELELTLERGWGWSSLKELNVVADRLQARCDQLECEITTESILFDLEGGEADMLINNILDGEGDDWIECHIDF